MKVLVVGSGGREHALAWKASGGEGVSEVLVAPGNAGTAAEPGVRNVPIDATDIDALMACAREENVAITIVGPEAPLVAGIVDRFTEAGLPCFGPSRAAAQLEGSKAYSKDFLARHRIPTAAYRTFERADDAVAYIRREGAPIVVKADGLAAGKGVVVAMDESAAIDAVQDMLENDAFGNAGSRVVLEEFMEGEEASFICLCDGVTAIPLATSQDHKTRDDGDRGPNTGGMGAYSPAPVVDADVHARVMTEIVSPTLAGMRADGCPYVGFLYVGLMIDAQGGPRVVEFNCRFGDPEAQPVMLRLRSDLVALCRAAIDGKLAELPPVDWDPRPALGVVMAAGGYPLEYRKGEPISGLDVADDSDVKVFHAGTQTRGAATVTSGGRVLCVTALGATVADAQRQAYERTGSIHWQDVQYRSDIGYRAVARETR